MIKLLLALLFFIFSEILPAQPAIQWQKSFGGSDSDEARCIQQTTDGGYIVVGNILSNNGDVFGNHGGWDFWIVKTNNTGSIQWKKTFGGTNNDWPYAIQQTNDEGYIVAGFTESNNGDVSGNHGDKDAWVLKLSSTGAVQWKKCYGGSGWEEATSIQQTADGGYIFAGLAQSSDGDVSGVHGDLDFWVVKLSVIGAIEWQKALGGSNEDIARSIKQTSEGGYIIAGKTLSNDGDVSGNHGNVDYWVVKLTISGEVSWQKALGGADADDAFDIDQTTNGEYIVNGYSGSGNTGDITGHHGGSDFWVVRLSETGALLWQKALGGNSEDLVYSGSPTSDDGYVLAGRTLSTNGDVTNNHGARDYWVVKLNAIGELVWQKTFGGSQSEVAYSIQQTNDNGYVICGYAWSNDGDVSGVKGYDDFWVVKLSPLSAITSSPLSAPLEIFPNPATSTIAIRKPLGSTEEEPSLNISISDLLGRELSRQTLSDNNNIDISSLPNGLHLVTATTPSGKLFFGKFTKQSQ